MGLDMFLHKVKREEVAYWRKANAINKWFEDHCANGNLENCHEYPVTKEQLIELRDTCNRVLNTSKIVTGKVKNGEVYNKEAGKFVPCYETGEVIKNPELAQEILPTQNGFFFGQTEYNQWYINDLKNTVEQIDNILETVDFDEYDIVYHAWW